MSRPSLASFETTASWRKSPATTAELGADFSGAVPASRFSRTALLKAFGQIDKESREVADPAKKQELIDTISRHAMISWCNVNMLGEYDFSDERLRDSYGLQTPKPAA